MSQSQPSKRKSDDCSAGTSDSAGDAEGVPVSTDTGVDLVDPSFVDHGASTCIRASEKPQRIVNPTPATCACWHCDQHCRHDGCHQMHIMTFSGATVMTMGMLRMRVPERWVN
eukprot:6464674-Amphidinium_carterae.1